jgi:hypothetical protein
MKVITAVRQSRERLWLAFEIAKAGAFESPTVLRNPGPART